MNMEGNRSMGPGCGSTRNGHNQHTQSCPPRTNGRNMAMCGPIMATAGGPADSTWIPRLCMSSCCHYMTWVFMAHWNIPIYQLTHTGPKTAGRGPGAIWLP